MNDENKFSVDEILEAERKAKANGAPEEPEKTTPGVTEEPDAVTEPETEQPVEEASAEVAQPAPEAEPQPVEVQEDSPWDTYEEEEEPGKKKKNKKEKKEKKGFWARRREKKQKEVFNEAEDMYYGIQLKPIDEYTRGFDATGEISTQDEGYRKLFDENTAELDDEVAKDFERLQKERRRRVAEAVETAGVDLSAVEDELGIVAPVPVSVAMNDPNAVVPENKKTKDKVQNFQTAMLQDAQTHTMEIKLDLENETFGLQQAKVVPEVSEDSVRRILESVQAENAAKQAAQVQNAEQQAAAAPKTEESDAPEMAFKDISSNGPEPGGRAAGGRRHGHCFRRAAARSTSAESGKCAGCGKHRERRRRSGRACAAEDLRAGNGRDAVQKARLAGAHHQCGCFAKCTAERSTRVFRRRERQCGRCAPL